MTIWMEVDVKNKELPTGRMATRASTLARMCGIHPSGVTAAMLKAAKQNRPCKYVRVEIEEDDDD